MGVTMAADYNVGNLSGQPDKLPSTTSNYHTLVNNTEEGVVLSGSDRLGYIVNNNLNTSFGKEEWTKSTVKITWPIEYEKTDWTNNNSGTVTPNVKVNGTLTVKGNAQVVLGGQYKQNEKLYGVDAGSSAEFTGIIANNLLVQEQASVNTWNAQLNKLNVEGGTVNIHTAVPQGNSYFNYDSPVDSKQAHIREAINISGGTTTIGRYSADDAKINSDHIGSCFGSLEFVNPSYGILGNLKDADSAEIRKSQITQTGGSFIVAGMSASVGGLNIDQQGGTMNISTDGKGSDAWHLLSDYGDSKIEQSGGEGTILNIGGIAAYNSKYDEIVSLLQNKGVSYDQTNGVFEQNGKKVDVNPFVELIQSGTGTINIYKGIDFSDHRQDSIEDSTITQSGGGDINLGGTYSGVTFDIEQKENGGNIAVNGNLATDIVAQDGAGNIEVAEGATLTANNVYAGTVTKTVEGDVTSYSGSVEISGANLIAGKLSTNGSTVTNTGTLTADTVNVNAGSLKVDGNGSLSANSISANNGNVSINTNASLSNGAISIDGDTVTNTGNLSAGQIVVNGGTFINEGNINYTAPSALLALGSDEDNALLLLGGTTDASDVVVKGGDFVNIGNVGSVLVEEGGTLTMEDQSSASSIVMDGGRINVTGESTVGSLTLNGENNVINFDFSNVETAPSIVLNSGEALDLSSTTIMVTVSTEMLENLAGQNFDLFGGNVENITNATFVFTDGDADTSNDKTADVTLGSSSGSIKVENIQSVPEPTTATLSLLALCGLAMRRRRK